VRVSAVGLWVERRFTPAHPDDREDFGRRNEVADPDRLDGEFCSWSTAEIEIARAVVRLDAGIHVTDRAALFDQRFGHRSWPSPKELLVYAVRQ
jgi:hypothetical protein